MIEASKNDYQGSGASKISQYFLGGGFWETALRISRGIYLN
jgi:hypothetical protein